MLIKWHRKKGVSRTRHRNHSPAAEIYDRSTTMAMLLLLR
jgi:hypothetical protein